MPISEKIINEINNLNVNNEDKDLLIKVLQLEDNGVKHYKAPYEKEIHNYLEKHKEEVGSIE